MVAVGLVGRDRPRVQWAQKTQDLQWAMKAAVRGTLVNCFSLLRGRLLLRSFLSSVVGIKDDSGHIIN